MMIIYTTHQYEKGVMHIQLECFNQKSHETFNKNN